MIEADKKFFNICLSLKNAGVQEPKTLTLFEFNQTISELKRKDKN